MPIGPFSRRGFVQSSLAAAFGPNVGGRPKSAPRPGTITTSTPAMTRAQKAYMHRRDDFKFLFEPMPVQTSNGDEDRYDNRFASFSKTLPHDDLGIVDPAAYDALLRALDSGDPADFEAIPRGVVRVETLGQRELTSPQAAFAFTLEGPDPFFMTAPPAPRFDSAEQAGEMVENYWMARLRDVPFTEYSRNDLAWAACEDLSRLSDYRAPKSNGMVIPEFLFRGVFPGELVGPYTSQFLLKPFNMGATPVFQKVATPQPRDFLGDYQSILAMQRGVDSEETPLYQPNPRYVRDGRQLGEWVHVDNPTLPAFNALHILMGFERASLDPANPLLASASQMRFVTFGCPDIVDQVARVANLAMKCAWFQKWKVHRRLRPEVYAMRVHDHLTGRASYPLHEDLLNSDVLDLYAGNGQFVLPQAYPEGSPAHPSYLAGHATFAGATCTILKAWFDEDYPIEEPLVPSADGLQLLPWEGETLTVGGELNKLASNIAIARNIAGVHWRSDALQSLRFGEEIAIRLLRSLKECYNEPFEGWSLQKFDGTRITI